LQNANIGTAASIAINEALVFLKENDLPEKIIFCCFDPENFAIYQRILL